MKLALVMKNRRGRRGAPRLSLFPFLAVLICTMGALVLLFLVVTRQARLQAVREAAAKLSGRHEDLKAEREAAQWRVEQLQKSREGTQSQLADARLMLGHLEDHSRRLRARLAELQAAAKNLDDVETLAARQRGGTEEELRQLQAKIAEAERQLTDARQAAQKRPPSYSIIPYEGPSQTRRRPIYLECREDCIILQPEGIRFTSKDFPEVQPGKLDEGNPLAVGLRAVEQFFAQAGFDSQHGGQPYPLLLVRPSGINAYSTALAALKSWGSEFGYELIGEQWKLQFPPPDARLAQLVEQAAAPARARQMELALAIRAATATAVRTKRPNYRVLPSGAVVREGEGDDDRDLRSAEYAGRVARRYGPPDRGRTWGDGGGDGGGAGGAAARGEADSSGAGARRPAGGGTDASGSDAGGSGVAALPYARALGSGTTSGDNPGSAAGDLGSPGGTGSGPGGTQGRATAGGAGVPQGAIAVPGTRPSAAGSHSAQPSGSPPGGPAGETDPSTQGRPQAGRRVERPEDYVAGRPYEPQPGERPSAGGEPAAPLRPGEWRPSEEYAPPPKRNDDRDDKQHRRDAKSLAEKRGRDWGLRDAARGSVPNTRPIRVDCYPDRLVLVPDDPRSAPKVIPLGGPTEGSIDKFIAAVWEQMDSWGIAGRGMYWRPILSVYVAPGAEQRFEEFSRLLEGSGLGVKRK